jgi:hypothetical protein
VKRSDNIVHIKAVSTGGEMWGVKAISPSGQHHDVKGVKMSKEDIEATINGVEIYAHVKALPQVPAASE